MKAIAVSVAVLMIASANQSQAMNGGDWYTTCNQWLRTNRDQMKSLSPEKKVAYRACQIEAIRVYCDLNFEGDAREVGKTVSDEIKKQWATALSKSCPNIDIWNMPFGGPPVFAVKELEKEGGPSFVESYLPASWVLKRAFQKAFQGCERERERLSLFNNPKVCFNGWIKNIDD